jgi:kynureninase
VGWFSHLNPFEFNIEHFAYASDARRFWGGTPSVLPYVVATPGLQLIYQIGVPAIRTHNLTLTGRLVHFARQNNLKLLTPASPAQRGGTICIQFPHPEEVYRKLKQEQILVDFRPNFGVRFSPHIYNSGDEIEKLISHLSDTGKI